MLPELQFSALSLKAGFLSLLLQLVLILLYGLLHL